MAQRKSSPGGKPVAKKGPARPAGRPTGGSSARAAATRGTGAVRKPGKSIVNQRQTPWGLIASIAAVVVFAAAVVIVVIATRGGSSSGCGTSDRYNLCELPAAKSIKGLVYKHQEQHNHVTGTVNYKTTPPTGGNHSADYADCSGTVYANPIASENAVHALEHGAVWVTYRQGLSAAEVTTLKNDVTGQDHVLMSPYPNLRTKVSLQAWGYQLFVNSVSDSRINQFIGDLAGNAKISPELASANTAESCANSGFKSKPSTFGHPL